MKRQHCTDSGSKISYQPALMNIQLSLDNECMHIVKLCTYKKQIVTRYIFTKSCVFLVCVTFPIWFALCFHHLCGFLLLFLCSAWFPQHFPCHVLLPVPFCALITHLSSSRYQQTKHNLIKTTTLNITWPQDFILAHPYEHSILIR